MKGLQYTEPHLSTHVYRALSLAWRARAPPLSNDGSLVLSQVIQLSPSGPYQTREEQYARWDL